VTVASGAFLAPGVGGIGNFNVAGGVTLAGTLAVGVDTIGAGVSDIFSVGGALDLSAGTSAIDFSVLGALDDPAYVFASYGSLNGTFGTVSNLPTGYTIDYGYLGNFIALVPVPEPTTISTLGCAAALALFLGRRRGG
jgi:hypothetical protein